MAEASAVKATISKTNYITRIQANEFTIPLDEPIPMGGSGTAPGPFDYLYASLAGCVGVTLRMYADRKEWHVGNISVVIIPSETEEGETLLIKKVSFEHDVTEDQKKKLAIIADKCPVSKLLKTGLSQKTEVV